MSGLLILAHPVFLVDMLTLLKKFIACAAVLFKLCTEQNHRLLLYVIGMPGKIIIIIISGFGI